MATTLPPAWAGDFLGRVWTAERPHMRTPALTWARRRTPGTSGTAWTWEHRLHVTAGRGDSRAAVRIVLAHEIAHLLAPTTSHHDETFWGIFWRIVREYRLGQRDALRHCARYRTGLRTARALGIRGAATALRQVRADAAAGKRHRSHRWSSLGTPERWYVAPDGTIVYDHRETCRVRVGDRECGAWRSTVRPLTEEEAQRFGLPRHAERSASA